MCFRKSNHVTNMIKVHAFLSLILQLPFRKGAPTQNLNNSACFIAVCFTVLHRHCIFFVFTNQRSVATLCRASLSAPFFQQYLLTSCFCHILVILELFQTSSLLYFLQWSVVSDYNALRAQRTVSIFSNKIFLNLGMQFFFWRTLSHT